MRSSTHRGMKEQMHQGYSKMEGDTPKGSSNVLYFTLCHSLCDTVENFNATALRVLRYSLFHGQRYQRYLLKKIRTLKMTSYSSKILYKQQLQVSFRTPPEDLFRRARPGRVAGVVRACEVFTRARREALTTTSQQKQLRFAGMRTREQSITRGVTAEITELLGESNIYWRPRLATVDLQLHQLRFILSPLSRQ